jgi:uncharacterized protein
VDTLNQSVPPVADEPECNLSSNPWFSEIVERRIGRREIVTGGVAATVSTLLATPALGSTEHRWDKDGYVDHDRPRPRIDPGFQSVAASNPGREDEVVVPAGYTVQVLIPEGTPVSGAYPPYIPGDYNTGVEREQQVGAHHDGMHFFPLQRGKGGNESGLLCVNHENIDHAFIHPLGFNRGADGSRPVEDEVRKEVASHGVCVVAINKNRNSEWKPVRSRFNRRITANTPMEITGPARGSATENEVQPERHAHSRHTEQLCERMAD